MKKQLILITTILIIWPIFVYASDADLKAQIETAQKMVDDAQKTFNDADKAFQEDKSGSSEFSDKRAKANAALQDAENHLAKVKEEKTEPNAGPAEKTAIPVVVATEPEKPAAEPAKIGNIAEKEAEKIKTDKAAADAKLKKDEEDKKIASTAKEIKPIIDQFFKETLTLDELTRKAYVRELSQRLAPNLPRGIGSNSGTIVYTNNCDNRDRYESSWDRQQRERREAEANEKRSKQETETAKGLLSGIFSMFK